MAMKRTIRERRRRPENQESLGRKRPRTLGHRTCLFAILSIAQIYLQCTILHHNVHSSNALIPNQPPTFRQLSILSTTSVSKETDVPMGFSKAKKSFKASLKINYKPIKDFRTHDDQERLQLDWMVRNTAKVLGDDAAAPGVSLY